MQNSDITIIGGGVMGLLTAREFLNAGASVTLLEKNACGQEASWAGGGILLPLYPWRQSPAISDLVMASLTLYPTLAKQLYSDTGIDCEWTQSGLLMTQMAHDEETLAHQWADKYDICVQTPQSSDFAPLNITPQHPLLLPEIAQIRNPRLLDALKADVLKKGLHLVEHCEITHFTLEHQKLHDIHTSHGKFPVHEVILTAGAWTRSIFQQCLIGVIEAPEIYPAKGQMLIFEAPPETLKHIVLHGEHYLIPRRDGKILVGSTVEYHVFHKDVTVEAHESLFNFASHLLPSLNTAPMIKHWAGLRPATEDGVPYIGRHPEITNLSLNAGHFRNGLTMAPASAQLLADIILNRPSVVDPQAYQFFKHLS
ncbi:MAG TPA: glycine oxidase ThiO [Methylococcaceae bacterium]|nr:glycine oxidase ThiO [Methylococcaceae bacterium]